MHFHIFESFCVYFSRSIAINLYSHFQEEYLEEGITWTPVKFFNNKLVCDLIENKVSALRSFV